MSHIRVDDKTKKNLDKALITAQAIDPNVKTNSDLQNFLMDRAKLRSIDDIVLDDLKVLEGHLKLCHPDTLHVFTEQSVYFLREILLLGLSENPDIVLKGLKQLKKEIE